LKTSYTPWSNLRVKKFLTKLVQAYKVSTFEFSNSWLIFNSSLHQIQLLHTTFKWSKWYFKNHNKVKNILTKLHYNPKHTLFVLFFQTHGSSNTLWAKRKRRTSPYFTQGRHIIPYLGHMGIFISIGFFTPYNSIYILI